MNRTKGRALVAALFFALALAAYLIHVRKDMTDFGVGYQAGARVLAGETLYRSSDGHLQFKYAPASALFYAPFGLLPWEAAKAVWYGVVIALLAGSAGLTVKLLPDAGRRRVLAVGLALLVLAKYLGREIELGQVNLLILVLLLAMVRAWTRGRDLAAGVLWSLSLFFKPYAAVFLPYLILRKKAKSLAAGLSVLVLGLAAPALVYGWRGNLVVLGEWASSLRLSTAGLLSVGDNASLFSFFYKIVGPGRQALAWSLFALSVLLLGLLFLWVFGRRLKNRERPPEVLEAAFLLTLIPLLSPLGWVYNYLYGFLAVAVILAQVDLFPPAVRWALGANFVLIGATLREVLGKAVFAFYTTRALAAVQFLVVLAALAYLRRVTSSPEAR
jgi:hypothetical protein